MENTKNIKERYLEAEGEMDYDFAENILFFKLKDREYDFSLDFDNIVIDVDKEQFVTGIQIFDASKFLGISKHNLKTIPKWQFKSKINQGVIEIRLFYKINIRNKIIEKTPIIIQENTAKLPSPQMVVSF